MMHFGVLTLTSTAAHTIHASFEELCISWHLRIFSNDYNGHWRSRFFSECSKLEQCCWYWSISSSCDILKKTALFDEAEFFVVNIIATQLIQCTIMMVQLYIFLSLSSVILVSLWFFTRGDI